MKSLNLNYPYSYCIKLLKLKNIPHIYITSHLWRKQCLQVSRVNTIFRSRTWLKPDVFSSLRQSTTNQGSERIKSSPRQRLNNCNYECVCFEIGGGISAHWHSCPYYCIIPQHWRAYLVGDLQHVTTCHRFSLHSSFKYFIPFLNIFMNLATPSRISTSVAKSAN